jgi:uncharacterized protein (UPF0332 family)
MSGSRADHSGRRCRRGCRAQRLHAAQALVATRTGKDAKTHKGAHTVFARLTKDEPRLDAELRRFLPQSYDLKAIADFEVGPGADVPLDRASAAIETAARFVACIEGILA